MTDRKDFISRKEFMAELYRYRMLYNAAAVNAWERDDQDFTDVSVVKSWKHHDGEECFGGGWFVVVAQLPTGQVSNHYKSEDWDLFRVPAVDLAPEWDGHDPAEAERRLRAYLEEGRAAGKLSAPSPIFPRLELPAAGDEAQ